MESSAVISHTALSDLQRYATCVPHVNSVSVLEFAKSDGVIIEKFAGAKWQRGVKGERK